MFLQEEINSYSYYLDALDIVPDCYGKACGDSCGRNGICKKRGTRVFCDFTFLALGCNIGEPLGMFYIIINIT